MSIMVNGKMENPTDMVKFTTLKETSIMKDTLKKDFPLYMEFFLQITFYIVAV